MTQPVTADDQNVTLVTRTLLLLPTLIGLVGIGTTILAGVFGGVTDGPQGWAATGIAALAVTVTVVTGGSYGLYAGLTILAVGGLVADGGPSALEITALSIMLLVVHEIIRFSLDARNPSRFGPGVIIGYLSRLVACCGFVAMMSAVVHAVIARSWAGGLLVPVGLAVAGVPLYLRRGAELLEQTAFGRRQPARAIVGTILTVVLTTMVVTLAAIGAQTQSESSDEPPATSTATQQKTTTTVQTEAAPSASEQTRTVPRWAVLLGVIALAVMIYLILQRDEAIFELEDVDRRVEEGALDLAIGQLGNPEDETIEVDEDALARMLRDLQLDISAEEDPGRAIRFGYAKIEQRLGEQKLTRTAVETEREFLMRAMPRLGSAGDSMTMLTRLFEAARFGHEPVSESMRQEALVAIEALLGELGNDRSEGGSGDRTEGEDR